MSPLTVAIVLAIAAAVYSLACGVSTMATGKQIGHHTGEEWMIRRIAFQALAVILLLLAMLTP
jgi:hypothetical protein